MTALFRLVRSLPPLSCGGRACHRRGLGRESGETATSTPILTFPLKGGRNYSAKPDGTHSNTVESAFSLLKRGIYGTFHNVSRKHLHRYVAEFDFRWNARKVDDCERLALAVRSAEGKRLRYKQPLATFPPSPAQGKLF
jgi:ISXO2-like transposase domain